MTRVRVDASRSVKAAFQSPALLHPAASEEVTPEDRAGSRDGAEVALEVLAHEIRGALATMLVSLELLDSDEAWQSGDVSRLIEKTRRSAEWIAELVDNPGWAAELARASDLRCEPLSIYDIVESCIEITEPMFAERRQRIVLRFEGSTPLVYADETRITQVLVNLLRNASHYAPNDDTVSVRVAARGNGVRVEISDRGPGVPYDEQELIFRRFRRGSTKANGEYAGQGLGLYLARALIEAHHGTIGVQSEPGHGATFWFTLPGLNAAALQSASSPER